MPMDTTQRDDILREGKPKSSMRRLSVEQDLKVSTPPP